MLSERAKTETGWGVLGRLQELCAERGLEALARNLAGLAALVDGDLDLLEEDLGALQRRSRLSERAATHLLELGGKRLRPLCVLLAARVGSGYSSQVRDLAVAVELVHNATLLHDDVIDLAPTRRGRPTARTEMGNAASIFGGDWLLIEALRRVRRAEVPETLDRLLDTIAEMIEAESIQLENRGRLEADRELYFRIADGKSATLFQWGLWSGGAAGGLDLALCDALGEYGRHLGVAFQVVDDLLDVAGEPDETGKCLFTDLREGKLTFPLIVALERRPVLRPVIEEAAAHVLGEFPNRGADLPERLLAEIQRSLVESGAVAESRRLAAERIAAARASLERLPQTEATRSLALVAEATVHRTH